MSKIVINSNGTTQPVKIMATPYGYQFAVTPAKGAVWGSEVIKVQLILSDGGIQVEPITIATINSSAVFVEKILLPQGSYIQFVITGASVNTNLAIFYNPLGVYAS